MSSYSEPCTWTEESVVRIKRLPTNTLGGKVRYRHPYLRARLSLKLTDNFIIKSNSGSILFKRYTI